MTVRNRITFTFLSIAVLTALSVLAVVPGGPNIRIGSWERSLDVRLGLDLQGGTHLVYDADTSAIIPGEEQDAIEGVRDVIERRVNAYGVSEPVVQTNRSGEQWRVIVELAGVTDIAEAINLIGETPLLEFKQEGEPPAPSEEEQAAYESLVAESRTRAESVLARVQEPDADFATIAKEESADQGSAELGGDLGFFGTGVMVPEFETAVFDAAVGTLVPQIVESAFGFHVIEVTGEQTNDAGEAERSARHILIAKPQDPSANAFPTYDNTGLSGKNLKRAGVEFDPTTGEPIVTLSFDSEGGDLFAELTEQNVGKTIAIYLDGQPISVPRVNQKITGGQAVISGSFTLDEAKTLSRRLNAGALPVPISLVSEQRIGPALGQESVERSFIAGVIGLLLVALFMLVYYRLDGLVATLALLLYALIVFAIFKLWPVTLTLAGLAGFILSVGMAVDANVLIFERIREERRKGSSRRIATEEGFRRAWLSIRDSNVSSLITTVILAWFGTSLIQGFAITLGIGILVSMFSAISITRTLLRLSFVWFAKGNRAVEH